MSDEVLCVIEGGIATVTLNRPGQRNAMNSALLASLRHRFEELERQMIADMLLEAKLPSEALAEYEATLKSNPGRFNALYGAAQAAEQGGQSDKARGYYSQLLKNCDGAKSDRAELKHARERVEAMARASARLPGAVSPEIPR